MIKIPVKDLEPAFDNAIHWLHKTYNIDTVAEAVRWFKIAFNAYLFHDQWFVWEFVVFPNEEDATMFVLKFS